MRRNKTPTIFVSPRTLQRERENKTKALKKIAQRQQLAVPPLSAEEQLRRSWGIRA